MNKEAQEDMSVTLPVRKSAISSVESGIARIHVSHMDVLEGEDNTMAVLSNGKYRVVVKLVSDRLAPTGHITLRSKDMDHLDVKEGDEVQLEPYHRMTEDLKASWKKFVSRFGKKEEEEEEDTE